MENPEDKKAKPRKKALPKNTEEKPIIKETLKKYPKS